MNKGISTSETRLKSDITDPEVDFVDHEVDLVRDNDQKEKMTT
jgi:hypothetical protein